MFGLIVTKRGEVSKSDKIAELKKLMARVQSGIEKEARKGNPEACWVLNHLWS